MGRLPGGRPRAAARRDEGALSLFVAITAVVLLMLVGLVVDCGGRLRAVENADALAQEAARAGGEQIDQAAALRGDGFRLDQVKARAAACDYLAANGIGCDRAVVGTTDTAVTVTVHIQYHTLLLGVIGLGTLSVPGQGHAVVVSGPNQALNQQAARQQPDQQARNQQAPQQQAAAQPVPVPQGAAPPAVTPRAVTPQAVNQAEKP